MEYRIEGDLAQLARLTMNKGDVCWASKGTLMSFTPGIDWVIKMPGGIEGAARRLLSGEGLGLTYLTCNQPDQKVLLAANDAGKMIAWNLDQGPVLTTRGSFVATFGQNVNIDVVVARRAGAALFGGAGLFLQKVSGDGIVLIHGSGDFVEQDLQSGESILVSTGNLAALADEVDYDIQSVAGCRRMIFGGEGIFMTKLTGPGRVLLQSMKRKSQSSQSQRHGS